MKNIHVLPTDKPSRLLYNFRLKSFCIQKQKDGMYINDGKVSGADFWSIEKAINNGFKYVNIFITSDEEIKEGDWHILKDGDFKGELRKLITKPSTPYISAKTIITTDQDLIKDGIHSVEDDFLDWFCKNSTCQNVEFTKNYLSNDGQWKEVLLPSEWEVDTKVGYKTIIPKEEPKQESEKEMDNIKKYIEQELKKLDRGIVATPKKREHLESFAKANNGSMDILLMQMAINYGYKIALENFNEKILNLK